jgi:hypothetical protein
MPITIGRHRANAIAGAHRRQVVPSTGKPPVVFAGHGSFNKITDAKFPKVRLPPSVTMVFWCHHGEELLNTIGQFVEQNKPLSELPEFLQKHAADEGYDPLAIPEVVKGGSEIWNYRLTYPSGLQLGSAPGNVKSSVYNPAIQPASPHSYVPGVVRDNAYCIVPPLSGDVKDRGVPIIAMLAGYWEQCKDNVVHWCACRSIADR